MRDTHNKIVSYKNIEEALKIFNQKRKVLAGGCFDLIHYGHFVFLEKASGQGEVLVIALESDDFIVKRKKRTPVHSQQERAQILAGFSFIDLVILLPLFDGDRDYYEMVERIRPDIIAVTEGNPMIEEMHRQAELVGGAVRIVTPKVKEFSTSNILKNETISGD